MISEYSKRYEGVKSIKNREDIIDEITADSVADFLNDKEFIDNIAKSDKSITQKVIDFFQDIIDALNILTTDVKNNKASKLLKESKGRYEKARNLWADALDVASREYKNGAEVEKEGHNKYSINPEFESQYDSWNKKDRIRFHLGTSSKVFEEVGISPRNVYIDGGKILKMLNKHEELDHSIIKQMPNILENPILILTPQKIESANRSDTSVSVFSDVNGLNNSPIMVALELQPTKTSEGTDYIIVLSAYSRNNLENYIKNADIAYIDPNEERTNNWLHQNGLQLPVSITKYGSLHKIILHDDKKISKEKNKIPLKKSVEETKDLIALHNLTPTNLIKILKLGGIPMPSIAVTKSEIGHGNFGSISLVFDKNTIDPANKKNKVYSADAWTPTFPKLEYAADYEKANKIRNELQPYIDKLPNNYKDKVTSTLDTLYNNWNDYGGKDGFVEKFSDDHALKAAYLAKKGIEISEIKTETIDKMQEQDIEISKLGDNINDISDMKRTEIISNYGSKIREALSEYYQSVGDGNATEMLKTVKGVTLYNQFKKAVDYVNNKITSSKVEPDIAAMDAAIDKNIVQEDYTKWLKGIAKEIEADSGLYNGKELFTASGNRRSVKQLHLPFTVENIVKSMLAQGDGDAKNVTGFNGIKSIRASASTEFNSLDNIKASKDKLQDLNLSQQQAVLENLEQRMYEIFDNIINNSTNTGNRYSNVSDIGRIMLEASNAKKVTLNSVLKTFAPYNWKINEVQAKKIADLINDVKSMPVNLFEAKPERVVSFDEIKYAVVPNSEGKVIEELNKLGIPVHEYTDGNEEQRKNILNDLDDVKFALSKNLSNDLDKILNQEVDASETELLIGTTSRVLTEVLGAENHKVLMPVKKAYAAMVDEETGVKSRYYDKKVIKVLQASEDPVMILNPVSEGKGIIPNRLMIITDITDNNGKPIIVIQNVESDGTLNRKSITSNKVITIYDKKDIDYQIEHAAGRKGILYFNKEKSSPLASALSVQFAHSLNKNELKENIQHFWNNVNYKNNKGGMKTKYTDHNASAGMSFKSALDSINLTGIDDHKNSLKLNSVKELVKKNEELKSINQELKRQFKLTKGYEPRSSDIERIASKMLTESNSTYDKAILNENLKRLYKYINKYEGQNTDEVVMIATLIAKDVLLKSKNIDSSAAKYHSKVLGMIRDYTLHLDSKELLSLTNLWTFDDIRKNYADSIELSRDEGLSVDEAYEELERELKKVKKARHNIIELASNVSLQENTLVNQAELSTISQLRNSKSKAINRAIQNQYIYRIEVQGEGYVYVQSFAILILQTM